MMLPMGSEDGLGADIWVGPVGYDPTAYDLKGRCTDRLCYGPGWCYWDLIVDFSSWRSLLSLVSSSRSSWDFCWSSRAHLSSR